MIFESKNKNLLRASYCCTFIILSQVFSLSFAETHENHFIKEKEINGETIIFEKILFNDDEETKITNTSGKIIEKITPSKVKKIQIDEFLLSAIEYLGSNEKLWVSIIKKSQDLNRLEQSTNGEAHVYENAHSKVYLNGVLIDTALYLDTVKNQEFGSFKGSDNDYHKNNIEIETQYLSKKQIMAILKNKPNGIIGIERAITTKDDMDTAVVETGIDPWAFFPWRSKGAGTRVYISEAGHCIDEDTHFIPGYVDVRNSTESTVTGEHSIKTTSVFHKVSPHANIHCGGGGVLAMPSVPSRYDAISSSQSSQLYGTYSGLEKIRDNFIYNHDVAIFQAAGNDGTSELFVKSPGNAFNVITVGNYNHKSGAPTINPKSSWKNGQTGIQKPEILAPGTNLDIRGIGTTYYGRNGTSYSTPHAAGFYTNFLGDEPWFKGSAALAKAYMISHATIAVMGGKDKTGEGGIHYRKAGGNVYWWNENNAKWNELTNDGNYLTMPVAVNWSRAKAKVSIAWLVRGDYTYIHRNDAHPIGTDYDMRIVDANDNYVCGSASWDNNYESCSWTLPEIQTAYRIKINRYANRDINARIKLAIVSHSFNDE